MEYRCPCGKIFDPKFNCAGEDYFDGEDYVSIWEEVCPHCGKDLRVAEVYKMTEVFVQEDE